MSDEFAFVARFRFIAFAFASLRISTRIIEKRLIVNRFLSRFSAADFCMH